jgi:membrane-bound lytic murein transglycosylase B
MRQGKKLYTQLAVAILLSVLAFASSASAKTRPAVPKGVAWVSDPTDAQAIVSALSGPRTATTGTAHQLAIHAIVLNPTLRVPVLAGLDDPKRKALIASEIDAAMALRKITKSQPILPAWRIVEPTPEQELRAAYEEAQSKTGVPWQYLAAVNFVETKFGRIRGTSIAGAQGPMQFLPSTWKQYGKGGDINSDRDAIAAAARFLQAKGAPGDMRRALFRYNNSTRYVDAVSTYAQNMINDPTWFSDYHGWNVVYRWTEGDVYLMPGYER